MIVEIRMSTDEEKPYQEEVPPALDQPHNGKGTSTNELFHSIALNVGIRQLGNPLQFNHVITAYAYTAEVNDS